MRHWDGSPKFNEMAITILTEFGSNFPKFGHTEEVELKHQL